MYRQYSKLSIYLANTFNYCFTGLVLLNLLHARYLNRNQNNRTCSIFEFVFKTCSKSGTVTPVSVNKTCTVFRTTSINKLACILASWDAALMVNLLLKVCTTRYVLELEDYERNILYKYSHWFVRRLIQKFSVIL